MKKGLFKVSLIALAAVFLTMMPMTARATVSTTNPSPASPGYIVLPLTFSRTITATATPIVFQLPYPCTLVSMTARGEVLDTSSGDETYTVDLKMGSTSVLNAALSLAAQATTYQASIKTSALTDESTMSVVLTLGGTTPSLTDCTVFLVLKRQ